VVRSEGRDCTWGIALISSERRRVLWSVLCLLVTTCARGPGAEFDPRLTRLVPAWGVNSGPVSATLEGENFLPVATRHVGGEEPVTLESRFQVFLGGERLGEVTLADSRTLRFELPAGLAPGWYDVAVETPLGGRAELPRAYFASAQPLAALQVRSAWQRDRLWVGEETRLVLTVENTGGTRARAVQPELRFEGQMDVKAEPAPADVEPGASEDFTWTLGAVTPGRVNLHVTPRGEEESSGVALEPPPVETVLQVRERAEPSASFEVSPRVVNVGRQVRVTLHVDNPGTEPLRDVVPTALVMEGTGGLSLGTAGPVPARADVAPGEGRDFVWSAVASREGEVVVQGGAGGTDDFTGNAVFARKARAEPLTVKRPGRLTPAFTLVPASVKVGETFDVDLEVLNPGDSAVLGVTLEQEAATGTGQVGLVSGPEPTSVDIPGQGRVVFRARLVAQQRGTCVLHVGARGVDQTDGTSVVAPPVASSTVTLNR
jgi:hypothetical protein